MDIILKITYKKLHSAELFHSDVFNLFT